VRLSMRPITFFLFLLIGCAGIHGNVMGEATNASAVAEDYPIKPVRLIEPFGAGGGPDLLARALAQQLSSPRNCNSRPLEKPWLHSTA
jgi:tripartite-type tricarboxylate transporter receptor subunit TctC